MKLNGTCPICEANLRVNEDVQISEILSCPDCSSFLFVESKKDHTISLKKAPEIEEDWGE